MPDNTTILFCSGLFIGALVTYLTLLVHQNEKKYILYSRVERHTEKAEALLHSSILYTALGDTQAANLMQAEATLNRVVGHTMLNALKVLSGEELKQELIVDNDGNIRWK